MRNATIILMEYWRQRGLIPVGVWLLLISYSLAAFGSPMPPNITWLEITIGCGLLLGGILLLPTLADAGRGKKARSIAVLAGALLFIPLVWGLYSGNSLASQARDVIPLLFLLAMPILLVLTTSATSKIIQSHLIAITLVIVGSIAAMIFYSGVFELYGSPTNLQVSMSGAFSPQSVEPITAERIMPAGINPDVVAAVFIKLYDPAILFAGIFFSSVGMVLLVKSWQSSLFGIALIVCGAIIAYGFMIVGLRAYTALLGLAVLSVCMTQIKQRGFYMRVVPLVVIGIFAFWTHISAIIQLLLAKQQMMGSNGKSEEWLAVLSTITASPQAFLFGLGWGGTFENPILGEQTRFTHSMVSFYLLKSGVTGLCILLLIFGLLLGNANRIAGKGLCDIQRLVLLASCLPPLLIGVLFQPIYKMLSYGVILALFILVFPASRNIMKPSIE